MGAAVRQFPIRPDLKIAREGNVDKKKLRKSVVVPIADLEEPDWSDVFEDAEDPEKQPEIDRLRRMASAEWSRVVPILTHAVGLSGADESIVRSYCVSVARLDQCERGLSREGLLMRGERGMQKNGYTTIKAQYALELSRYVKELGLSPSARGRMTAPEGDSDGEDVDFD